MNPEEEIDPQLFRELRRRSMAPPVDVADRVLATIQQGPMPARGLDRWTMAISAALCGAAACAALTAALVLRSAGQSSDAADLMLNTYDVEIESLIR